MFLKRLFLVSVTVACAIASSLATVHIEVPQPPRARNSEIADSLRRILSATRNPADSLLILQNIIDLTDVSVAKDSLCRQTIELSLRHKEYPAGLSVLRTLANVHTRDEALLSADRETAMLFPASGDREETVTFLRMLENIHYVSYRTEAEKVRHLQQLLEEFTTNPPEDIHDRIVLLHAMVLHVADVGASDVLMTYIRELESAIDELGSDALAVQNCLFVHGALVFNNAGDKERAIAYDKRLLQNMKRLEKTHHDNGLKYRNYDSNRYVVYRRLLSNYDLLPPDEVEAYYKKVKEILARDKRSYDTYIQRRRVDIYYCMFKKDYPQALSLLKTYRNDFGNSFVRRDLLRHMLTAARAVGDTQAELEASAEYTSFLEETLRERSAEKVRELQIIYDIHGMNSAHERKEAALRERSVWILSGAAVFLFILLVVMYLMYRHSTKMSRNLRESNSRLLAEQEQLRGTRDELVAARDQAQRANRIKSDFIKNMSSEVEIPVHTITEYTNLIVDCAEATDAPYLRHFCELITYNTSLLSKIVSDLLSLAEIDTATLDVKRSKVALLPLCRNSVKSVEHRVSDGVTLTLAPGLPDVTVDTDPVRLSQILFQVLCNAAKFTEHGTITLSYEVFPEVNRVEMRVTDTGKGIPTDEMEHIFERFVQVDPSAQGAGLGLPLARQIARLLGGDLTLGSTSEFGSTFIISLPINY